MALPPRVFLMTKPSIRRLLFTTASLVLTEHASTAFAFNPSSTMSSFSSLSTTTSSSSLLHASSNSNTNTNTNKIPTEQVLFVECGFGNDSHGQNPTKAAIRACRNAIEFNSIPSIKRLVPGGYDQLKLEVLLAVPKQYQGSLDLEQVRQVFPYGTVVFEIQDGGMVAPSGIAIDELGDKNEDMIVVCCSVTVGY